ncbi:MAG: hypothetical protein SGBAC_000591 [Bacillariaceae sp.]
MVTLRDRFKQLNELKQLTANQPQFVPPQAEESSQSSSEDDDATLDDVGGDKNVYEHAEDAIPESEAAGEPKDEDVISQYRKMIKMGMSAGAVKQKMRNDGVHQRIVDSVFAVEKPLNEGVSDHPVEDGNEVEKDSGLAPGGENVASVDEGTGGEGSEANGGGDESQDSADGQSCGGGFVLANDNDGYDRSERGTGSVAAALVPPSRDDIEANTQPKKARKRAKRFNV